MARCKAVAPDEQEYFCRWPLTYLGAELDWGQIFKLAKAPNDAKLIRLGYIKEFDPREYDRTTCPSCGADFTGHNAKIDHVRARHKHMTEEQEDKHVDSLEKKLMQTSPLYLENSIASRN